MKEMLIKENIEHLPAQGEREADSILCLAIDLGENILKNGGEIARVEDTIERVCTYFGAEHVEAFAITTMIIASVRLRDGSYSHQLRHLKGSSMNMYRVEQLNRISREICAGKLSIEQANARIAAVKKKNPYSPIVYYIGAGMLTSGFTVFFGGSWLDALAAGVVGIVMSIIASLKGPFDQGMMSVIFNAFVAGTLSILFVNIGFGTSLDAILIGTIMFLIPGFALGFSVSDMVTGNLLSGLMRFLQSILTAMMIALGYSAALLLFGGVA